MSRKRIKTSTTADIEERLEKDPTQDEIAERCKAIRDDWDTKRWDRAKKWENPCQKDWVPPIVSLTVEYDSSANGLAEDII